MVILGERPNPMLCKICNKREATVHLTESGPGPETQHRNFCEVCFPFEAMSESKFKKKAIGLFQGEPLDEPEKPR